MGDIWTSGSGKHRVAIECKGWCILKPNKRKRWNYISACDNFSKRKKNGFIYEGGGGKTIEEDLSNITSLMQELCEDNSI